MKTEGTVVIVVEADGRVMAQNTAGRRLLGDGRGRACWQVTGGLSGASGLPCRTGCVQRLLAAGMERPVHARFALEGRWHSLTCVPLDSMVVCTIAPAAVARPRPWEALTRRESEVLGLLALGKTDRTIAADLAVSVATVRTHVEHMRAKLGVTTRAALVARAFEVGFL